MTISEALDSLYEQIRKSNLDIPALLYADEEMIIYAINFLASNLDDVFGDSDEDDDEEDLDNLTLEQILNNEDDDEEDLDSYVNQ